MVFELRRAFYAPNDLQTILMPFQTTAVMAFEKFTFDISTSRIYHQPSHLDLSTPLYYHAHLMMSMRLRSMPALVTVILPHPRAPVVVLGVPLRHPVVVLRLDVVDPVQGLLPAVVIVVRVVLWADVFHHVAGAAFGAAA